MNDGAGWLSKHWTDFAVLGRDLLVAILAAIGGVRLWMRMRKAASWPSVQGTVMSATARAAGNTWIGEFVYSYVVGGEYYSGSRQLRARSERRAEERIAGWKGRMVVVRYDHRHHEISVLLKEDQPGGQLGN